METTYYTITLNKISCCNCGLVFGIEEQFNSRCRETHQWFYCPNGHPQRYPQETEKERLQKQLILANTDKDRLGEMLRKKELEVKRVHRRIKNGICPHCNRYFKNIHRHMMSKHK